MDTPEKPHLCAGCGKPMEPGRALNALYCFPCREKQYAKSRAKAVDARRERRKLRRAELRRQRMKAPPPPVSLEEMARRATAAGMTYGQYVLANEKRREQTPPPPDTDSTRLSKTQKREETRQKALRMAESGELQCRIAKVLGVSRSTVSGWVKKEKEQNAMKNEKKETAAMPETAATAEIIQTDEAQDIDAGFDLPEAPGPEHLQAELRKLHAGLDGMADFYTAFCGHNLAGLNLVALSDLYAKAKAYLDGMDAAAKMLGI